MNTAIKTITIGALVILGAAMPLAATAAPKDQPKTHAAKHVKEQTAYGVVSAWTPATRTLKLQSGDEYKVADKVKAASYTAGQSVTVMWENKDGAKVADKITIK